MEDTDGEPSEFRVEECPDKIGPGKKAKEQQEKQRQLGEDAHYFEQRP